MQTNIKNESISKNYNQKQIMKSHVKVIGNTTYKINSVLKSNSKITAEEILNTLISKNSKF